MIKRYKQFFIADKLLESYSFHNKTRLSLLFNSSVLVMVLGIIATILSLILKAYPVIIPALGNVVLAILVQLNPKLWN